MTRYLSTHALERAITAQLRSAESLEQLRAAEGFDALQEIETQYQVPIWGVAAATVAWGSFDLHFDVHFFYAPEQRDSPLTVPHFTYGVVVSGVQPEDAQPDDNNPDAHILVTCHVTEWVQDSGSDAVIGARIGIGISTLGGGDVHFDGYVHLTFQGFGTVVETDATQGLSLG